ncbi:unnamed protein product, partial [marine sediment metagenome]
AITQTNRFKVAIQGSGHTDLISFSGTSDIPFYFPIFLGKPFWENPQLYLSRSPIMFVQNIKTPLLIFAGEKDLNVPMSQGEELYRSLQLQGKTVTLIKLKNQSHVPDNAAIIQEMLTTVNKWFEKALGKEVLSQISSKADTQRVD